MNNIITSAAVALMMLATGGIVEANTMTITLSGATFINGGTITGSVDYNTATTTYSNWNFTVDLTNPPAGSVDPFTYTTGNSLIDNGQYITPYVNTSATRVAFWNKITGTGLGGTGNSFRELSLRFASSLNNLTANRQTVAVFNSAGTKSGDKYDNGAGTVTTNVFTSGTFTVTTFNGVAIPIPGAVWLFTTGIVGLLGFKNRRKVAAVYALSA